MGINIITWFITLVFHQFISNQSHYIGSHVTSTILHAMYRAKNMTWSPISRRPPRNGLVMVGDGENARLTLISTVTKSYLKCNLKMRSVDILILLPFWGRLWNKNVWLCQEWIKGRINTLIIYLKFPHPKACYGL